jgi:hypothetical protein
LDGGGPPPTYRVAQMLTGRGCFGEYLCGGTLVEDKRKHVVVVLPRSVKTVRTQVNSGQKQYRRYLQPSIEVAFKFSDLSHSYK